MADWPAVARVINQRLASLGWTQKKLADVSRVSTATLRQIQQGQDKNRQPSVLTAISQALGLPGDYLQEVADTGREPTADEPATVADLRGELVALRERVAAIEARLDHDSQPSEQPS